MTGAKGSQAVGTAFFSGENAVPSGVLGALRSAVRRLRAMLGRHPVIVDSMIAALAFAAGGGDLVANPNGVLANLVREDAGVLGWLVHIGLALPLVFRRRWPSVVFGLVSAAAFACWLLDLPGLGPAAVLIAFYTVVVHEPGWRIAVATATLVLGAALAAQWWPELWGQFFATFCLFFVMPTGAVGAWVRYRRAYLASLVDKAARLELERDQQALLAAAAERARIAREMHDIVAHNVSVMIALADGAAAASERSPQQATEAMRVVSGKGRQVLGELRGLLGVLRDQEPGVELAPQPGLSELDTLISGVRAAGLPVTETVEGSPAELSPGAQLAVYRLVQEALTNTLKHGGPDATATVALRWSADRLEIEVTDTGRGGTVEPGGQGLTGMRARLSMYDGTVLAGPIPGGWRVLAELPVLPEPASREDRR